LIARGRASAPAPARASSPSASSISIPRAGNVQGGPEHA
jgi:hypothetical protein